MRRIAGTLLLLSTALASAADASRAHMPMGYYVRKADLIVVADTQKGGERGWDTVLHVREVIQGDPKWVGETIVLQMLIMSTADARVPPDAKGVAVLLRPGWKEAQRWPVLEAYQKPHELEALRILVKIYQKPAEGEQLAALRDVFAKGNPVCQEQLFADFRGMRDPENFHFITEMYPNLDPKQQRELVNLIAQIGDLRGVPTLIEAMSSPDNGVSVAAAMQLGWVFPGAPGVTEAYEKALEREHLAQRAARYLVRLHPDPRLKALAEVKTTRWRQAESLRQSGDEKAAKDLYVEIIEDKNESDYTRRSAAAGIVHQASTAEKERIRKALLPLLAKDAETENFIYALEAAKILRELQHPDCFDPLLRLLQWPSFSFEKAAQQATMAIRELGPEARQKATAHLIEKLRSAPDRRAGGENPERLLLELIWLGREEDLQEAELLTPARYRRFWQGVGPLLPLNRQEDEGAFLTARLEADAKLPRDARNWIAFRLGDLRDARAVDPLVRCLEEEPDWLLNRSASEALVRIGGSKVEQQMTRLLTHEDHNRVRRHAVETLFQIQGARSLAVSRRMLREKDFGLKGPACSNLGHVGMPEDLELLLPLCDYWTADRKIHYWAMSAVARIRGRYNYDIHGPIKIKDETREEGNPAYEPTGKTAEPVSGVAAAHQAAEESIPVIVRARAHPAALKSAELIPMAVLLSATSMLRAGEPDVLPDVKKMTMDELLKEFFNPPGGARLPSSQRQIDVMNALRKLGGPLVRKLKQDLTKEDSKVRIAAIRVLGSLGSGARGAVPELVEAMGDANDEIRLWAVRIVGHLKDPRAFYPLIKATQDPSPQVRGAAIRSSSAWLSDGRFAIAAVALSDQDRVVRRRAIYELQMLRDKRAVPLLMPLLDDTETNSYFVSNGVRTPDRNCDRVVSALEYIVHGRHRGVRPRGTEQQNDRKVNDWRQWWKANGDEFVRELYAEPELRRSRE